MTAAPIGIVVSEADPASVRIGEALRERVDWRGAGDAGSTGGAAVRTAGAAILTVEERPLDCDGIADRFRNAGLDPGLVVFASRHAGETGPLLTAHHTGNAGPAEHGGAAEALAIPAPAATRRALRTLDRHAPAGYDVAMECTHHGPSEVGAPSLFVEIGSGPEQWQDGAAAEVAAGAILALRDVDPHGRRAVVGFGGGHYAPRFGRVARETPWAVGHVLADWSLDAMPDPASPAGRDVIEQAVRTSHAGHALVAGERPAVREAVEACGVRVVREDWLRAVGDAPLPLVARVEDVLGSIADGVRLGEVARPDGPTAPPSPDAIRTARLPAALVEEARRIDREATRRAVAAHAVAYETGDSGVGTRLVIGPAADADGASPLDRIRDDLVDVLRDGYDRVERTEEAVVVEREVFDPRAAADRGVPEGPAFGRLADGESVTVDGATVEPDAVHRVERRRLPLEPPEPGEPKQK